MLSHWVVMAMYHAISGNANVLIRTYGPHCSDAIEFVDLVVLRCRSFS